jgi:hypothetical protein
MSEQLSVLTEFGRSVWVRVLGVLTVIMMMLGVYVEVVTAWRGPVLLRISNQSRRIYNLLGQRSFVSG